MHPRGLRLPEPLGEIMSACYKTGCSTRGTEERPLVIVAERMGASYGGFTVYGCAAHAHLYRPEMPLPTGRGTRA